MVGGKRSSGAAIDDDRLSPHGHAQGSCLFAHAATAGVALHGQLLHTQITRMTDNVQVVKSRGARPNQENKEIFLKQCQ